mmetsp:Transcript_24764/g.67365  ORF Transcript_24764/g.67365 Transcript_24764/m.67365 type:complete len:218 (-) Transcript_24764:212-865(-)|eukprot:CAMPEP_0185162088 /NCGR_PEP_ID=MMETSP1139-20130426/5975_1 /TAXON_ID=298111 /ORGANISM="Pavlova sp., Strain CCMP459" /LENGTH=217 /DNA_ID=CAMNT_0027727391 /DNA_START=176 /DNA_END=829 /DNA_ORIENTATION=+
MRARFLHEYDRTWPLDGCACIDDESRLGVVGCLEAHQPEAKHLQVARSADTSTDHHTSGCAHYRGGFPWQEAAEVPRPQQVPLTIVQAFVRISILPALQTHLGGAPSLLVHLRHERLHFTLVQFLQTLLQDGSLVVLELLCVGRVFVGHTEDVGESPRNGANAHVDGDEKLACLHLVQASCEEGAVDDEGHPHAQDCQADHSAVGVRSDEGGPALVG